MSTGNVYQSIREDIAKVIAEKNCGPILIRLSWHDAGTFCKASSTGGPRGCMRFAKGESEFGANAGLDIARGLLEPVKEKYGDKITYADLWSLAAVTAVAEMGGPQCKWRPGRSDAKSSEESVSDGRLPDGDKGTGHLRDIFHRMGFTDQEIVILSGAHSVGHCHLDRSGFEGAWSDEPYKFDNTYYQDILNKKWEPTKTSKGCPQYQSKEMKEGATEPFVMMLETDLALAKDEATAPWVKKYAEDKDLFFADFAKTFTSLQELGVKSLASEFVF